MKIERSEIHKGVMLYENILEGSEIIGMIEKMANDQSLSSPWEHSSTGNSSDISEYRSSLSFSLSYFLDPNINFVDQKKLFNLTMRQLNIASKDYMCRYLADAGFMEPPSILKYVSGGNYRTHSDDGPGIHRVVSLVGCLENTSSGGELEFPIIDLKIKLPINSIIVFPSNFIYKHYAHPVYDGVKYSLVTWWRV